MSQSLIDRLSDEADQCRNDGANDIAALLDEARVSLIDATEHAKKWQALSENAVALLALGERRDRRIRALRSVKPVCEIAVGSDGCVDGVSTEPTGLPAGLHLVWASPAYPRLSPLTEEQLSAVRWEYDANATLDERQRAFARAIERAHGIGSPRC